MDTLETITLSAPFSWAIGEICPERGFFSNFYQDSYFSSTIGTSLNSDLNSRAKNSHSLELTNNYRKVISSGIEESLEVFIHGNNLMERWFNNYQKSPLNPLFSIGELGYGVGLNLLTTVLCWISFREKVREREGNFKSNRFHLHFISFEKFPVHPSWIKILLDAYKDVWQNFFPFLEASEVNRFFNLYFNHYPRLLPQKADECGFVSSEIYFPSIEVSMTIFWGDALNTLNKLSNSPSRSHFKFDAIYLDGHSPKKNPDMWSSELLSYLKNFATSKTTFATYSSASLVKQNLHENSFRFEKVPGPGRKREVLRGSYQYL